jgi:quercetin dioxygenase-like cupin family protein
MVSREVCRPLAFAIAVLFAAPTLGFQDDGVQIEPLAKSAASWNGAQLPPYPTGQPEVTVVRVRVAAGARLPVHRHPVINAGFMLAGKLTVVTEAGQTLHLEAGDAIVEVVDQWHYGHNEGTEPAELIVFYAGVREQPVTVKQ